MVLTTAEILLAIQTLVFLATGVIVVVQLNNSRKEHKFSTTHKVWDEIQMIDRIVMETPAYAKFLGDQIPGATDSEIREYVFMFYVLNFAEMLFLLRRKGVLPQAEWEPWDRTIANWFVSDDLRQAWREYVSPRRMYTDEFRDYVEKRVSF